MYKINEISRRKVLSSAAVVAVGGLMDAVFSSSAGADFFETLNKVLDEGSKEGKILKGFGEVIGSQQEVDYETERTIGESLALEGFGRYGLPVDDKELQTYVNTVGAAVARNSGRPTIPYNFVVVDSEVQNAFACPGGIIFLSSALFKTLKDEAQLACVLAHEVAHVSHKHALQSIQRAKLLQGMGTITVEAVGGEKSKEFGLMINGLQSILFDKGLDGQMEYEADLTAMKTAYNTGYDPTGMPEVLRELKQMEGRSTKAGSWFSTHPPLTNRISKCENELASYSDRGSLARVANRFDAQRKKIR